MLKPPHHPGRHPPGATVVLVDPEALYHWFATESLRGCGVEVVASASIEEAAAYLRASGQVDLVIVDGELLRGDGQRLRPLRERAGVRLLVLDSDGELSRRGLGDVAVAIKPVDPAALVALLFSQLRRDDSDA